MQRPISVFFVLALMLAPGSSAAMEKVLVVADVSAGMWQKGAEGEAHIVALRSAFDAFLSDPEVDRQGIKMGLRVVGGNHLHIDEAACRDSQAMLPVAPADAHVWRASLAHLFPSGKRPLASAISTAVTELRAEGGGRILIITSGRDTCDADLATVFEEGAGGEPEIDFRIIGLGLDRETARTAALLVPTRNVATPEDLLESLRWAVYRSRPKKPKLATTEIRITRSGASINGATVTLTGLLRPEVLSAAVHQDRVRFSIEPGRYRVAVAHAEAPRYEFSEISVPAGNSEMEVDLMTSARVMLAVSPEDPLEGDEISVDFWGAPSGKNWVVLATPGAPVGEFLTRAPISTSEGSSRLRIPEGSRSLEARLLADLGNDLMQLLGRWPFQCRPALAFVEAPTTVETGSDLTISWTGPKIPGDHIRIQPRRQEFQGHETCLRADGESSNLTAPVIPGVYSISYVSAMGRTLSSCEIEVFEELAMVAAPAIVPPRSEMEVDWEGPGEPQDFVCVAREGSRPDQYIHWAPVSNGNPVRLRTPFAPGVFELRYVRAEDGQILATAPLEVRVESIALRVPKEVDAGARFEVHWDGRAGDHDMVAVATIDSGLGSYLDFSFMETGSPVTLAAPFEKGLYVVRYFSGPDRQIRARHRFRVR